MNNLFKYTVYKRKSIQILQGKKYDDDDGYRKFSEVEEE